LLPLIQTGEISDSWHNYYWLVMRWYMNSPNFKSNINVNVEMKVVGGDSGGIAPETGGITRSQLSFSGLPDRYSHLLKLLHLYLEKSY
jgi:hypothetical protein